VSDKSCDYTVRVGDTSPHAQSLEKWAILRAELAGPGFFTPNIGYRDLERWEPAWIQFVDVIARDGRMAGAFNNLAILEERFGLDQEAELHYRREIALKHQFPDAHFNLGMFLLRLGRFREGFAECEWRWQTSRFTLFQAPSALGCRFESRRVPLWEPSGYQQSSCGLNRWLVSERGLGGERANCPSIERDLSLDLSRALYGA
jgi:hypothetical protein